MTDDIGIDIEDYHRLMRAILKSAIIDYTSLQHPHKRRTSENSQAFASAVDMLFDNEYRAMKLHTPEGSPMGLTEIVEGAHPYNIINLDTMRHNITLQAKEEWQEADVRAVTIPEYLCINGQTYTVVNRPNESRIDFATNYIYQDQTLGQKSERQFIALCMEIAASHANAKVSKAATAALSDTWFEMLRMNACFDGN